MFQTVLTLQDGDGRSEEDGGEGDGGDGNDGGEEEGEGEGDRGRGEEARDEEENNSLSPMPSHPLSQSQPLPDTAHPTDNEDDRAHNYISYYGVCVCVCDNCSSLYCHAEQCLVQLALQKRNQGDREICLLEGSGKGSY